MSARRWLDINGDFYFGKHSGENVEDVAKEDPSYVEWIIATVADIDEDDHDAMKSALQFRNHRR